MQGGLRTAFSERRVQERKADIQTDARKYGPGLDPLEKEEKLKIIQPQDSVEQTMLMKMIKRLLRNTRNPNEQKALRMWKMNLKADQLKGVVHQEFVRDFWGWLIGRGKQKDHDNTPWGRQSLADDPSVSSYIDSFVIKMHEYKLKLALLGHRRPLGINQCYLYYKYIVRGQALDNLNFLHDWKLFIDEFGEARELGQDWMDKKTYVHPHETAPYNDDNLNLRKDFSNKKELEDKLKGPQVGADSTDDEDTEQADIIPSPRDRDDKPKVSHDLSSSEEEVKDVQEEDEEDSGKTEEQMHGELVDLLSQIRDQLQNVPRPPAAPTEPAIPVEPKMPVIVSDRAKQERETENLSIQLRRTQQNLAKLEERMIQSSGLIYEKLKAFETRETEEAKQARAERAAARAEQQMEQELAKKARLTLQSEIAELLEQQQELQEQVTARQDFEEIRNVLQEAITEQQEQMNRNFERALDAQHEAQVSFFQNAAKSLRELQEELQTGQVDDLKEFEEKVNRLQNMVTQLRERDVVREDQYLTQQEALAEMNLSFMQDMMRNLESFNGRFDEAVEKTAKEQREILKDVEAKLLQALEDRLTAQRPQLQLEEPVPIVEEIPVAEEIPKEKEEETQLVSEGKEQLLQTQVDELSQKNSELEKKIEKLAQSRDVVFEVQEKEIEKLQREILAREQEAEVKLRSALQNYQAALREKEEELQAREEARERAANSPPSSFIRENVRVFNPRTTNHVVREMNNFETVQSSVYTAVANERIHFQSIPAVLNDYAEMVSETQEQVGQLQSEVAQTEQILTRTIIEAEVDARQEAHYGIESQWKQYENPQSATNLKNQATERLYQKERQIDDEVQVIREEIRNLDDKEYKRQKRIQRVRKAAIKQLEHRVDFSRFDMEEEEEVLNRLRTEKMRQDRHLKELKRQKETRKEKLAEKRKEALPELVEPVLSQEEIEKLYEAEQEQKQMKEQEEEETKQKELEQLKRERETEEAIEEGEKVLQEIIQKEKNVAEQVKTKRAKVSAEKRQLLEAQKWLGEEELGKRTERVDYRGQAIAEKKGSVTPAKHFKRGQNVTMGTSSGLMRQKASLPQQFQLKPESEQQVETRAATEYREKEEAYEAELQKTEEKTPEKREREEVAEEQMEEEEEEEIPKKQKEELLEEEIEEELPDFIREEFERNEKGLVDATEDEDLANVAEDIQRLADEMNLNLDDDELEQKFEETTIQYQERLYRILQRLKKQAASMEFELETEGQQMEMLHN